MSMCHLRVVSWLLSIENLYVLMRSKWLFFCIEESSCISLLPYPFCFPVLNIAGHQYAGKWLSRKKNYRSVTLGYSVQLLPHHFKVKCGIPMASGCSVWYISQNQVYATILD